MRNGPIPWTSDTRDALPVKIVRQIGRTEANDDVGLRRSGLTRLEDPIGLDREGATRTVEPEDADQLLINVQLPAWYAQGAGDREEQALLGIRVAEDGVEDARQQRTGAEAACLDRTRTSR